VADLLNFTECVKLNVITCHQEAVFFCKKKETKQLIYLRKKHPPPIKLHRKIENYFMPTVDLNKI